MKTNIIYLNKPLEGIKGGLKLENGKQGVIECCFETKLSKSEFKKLKNKYEPQS